MTSYVTDGSVGPWAREKLHCLGDYLSAYTTILRKQSWCTGFFYVDAFAGGGRAPLRRSGDEGERLLLDIVHESASNADEQEYVDGSPRIALQIKHPFSEYHFIERDPERSSKLLDLTLLYPDRKISVLREDANEALTAFTARMDARQRAVVFLDPFGMHVPWRTITQLAKTKCIEVIVNLPIGMAIQRLLPRSGQVPQAWRDKLDEYFGSNEWFEIVYRESEDLFGRQTTKLTDAGPVLARWYTDRLNAEFGYASTPRLITNSKGGHLYYLIWAGPNATGLKIAEHVLRQGKSVG